METLYEVSYEAPLPFVGTQYIYVVAQSISEAETKVKDYCKQYHISIKAIEVMTGDDGDARQLLL